MDKKSKSRHMFFFPKFAHIFDQVRGLCFQIKVSDVSSFVWKKVIAWSLESSLVSFLAHQ